MIVKFGYKSGICDPKVHSVQLKMGSMIFLNDLCPTLGHRFKDNFPNRKVTTDLSHFSYMPLGGTRLTHFNGWLPGLFLFSCKILTSRVNHLPESF